MNLNDKDYKAAFDLYEGFKSDAAHLGMEKAFVIFKNYVLKHNDMMDHFLKIAIMAIAAEMIKIKEG
jgi:hypothetical protein